MLQVAAPSIRSSARYGAGVAPWTASSTSFRARRTIVSSSDQSGSARSMPVPASSTAYAIDSSRNSTGSSTRSTRPISSASRARRSLFWRSGFWTTSATAACGPISRGVSCVPAQAGNSPRNTSGKPRWRTVLAAVLAVQWSASSSPPPRHAPLTAATVGNGSVRIRSNSSWPARLPSAAVSGVTCGNSSMSAPAQNQNGLPVNTAVVHSPSSSSAISRCPDSSAVRPSDGGFVQSSPLSIVTSASGPAGVSTRRRWKTVSGTGLLPDDGGSHAEADAERRQAVASVLLLPERVRELRDEAHSRGSERDDRTRSRRHTG